MLNFHIKQLSNAISNYKTAYAQSKNFALHKTNLEPSLQHIKNLNIQDFNETSNIKSNLHFFVDQKKFLNKTNVGHEIASSVKECTPEVYSTIKEYSNTMALFMDRLHFVQNVDENIHKSGCQYIRNNLSNTSPLSEQMNTLNNIKIDTQCLGDIFLKCTRDVEVPILMDIHSFIELQPAVGCLTLNFYLIGLFGPCIYLSTYFLLSDSNNVQTILEKAIYTHTSNRDFKLLYTYMPTLPFELTSARGNLILVLLGGVYVCSGLGLCLPVSTSSLDSSLLNDVAKNLIKAGEANIPTPENNPIHHPIRTLVHKATFAITDVVLAAFKGISSAYWTNLYEQAKPVCDALIKNPPKK